MRRPHCTHQAAGKTARHQCHADEEHDPRSPRSGPLAAPRVARECTVEVGLVQQRHDQEAHCRVSPVQVTCWQAIDKQRPCSRETKEILGCRPAIATSYRTTLTCRADRRDPVNEGHVNRDDIVRRIRRGLGVRGERRRVEKQEEGERELRRSAMDRSEPYWAALPASRRRPWKAESLIGTACSGMAGVARHEILTSPPDRYVPTARVFGPTSNLGNEKRNTLRGSYDA